MRPSLEHGCDCGWTPPPGRSTNNPIVAKPIRFTKRFWYGMAIVTATHLALVTWSFCQLQPSMGAMENDPNSDFAESIAAIAYVILNLPLLLIGIWFRGYDTGSLSLLLPFAIVNGLVWALFVNLFIWMFVQIKRLNDSLKSAKVKN